MRGLYLELCRACEGSTGLLLLSTKLWSRRERLAPELLLPSGDCCWQWMNSPGRAMYHGLKTSANCLFNDVQAQYL